MSARSRSLALLGGGLALAAALLAGCATGGPAGPLTPAPPSTGGEEVEVSAAWLDGGTMIAVLVAGSSTCLPYADDVTYDAGVLAVSLAEPDRPCTKDLVLRGVDAAAALRVEVTGPGYSGVADLPGAPGLTPGTGLEGGQPSAGWADAQTLALLTWGSSSCPPELSDAVVSAPGEVTLTFAAPEPDRICTADMAPRVTVVPVSGAAPGTAYQAVLVSEGSEPARIPIAGTP
jgi:hypothetical protein